MKYIIDIPNDSINKYVSLCDRESFVVPITVGLDSSLCFNTGLKLKPYTEPDHKSIELQHAHDIENVARLNYNKGAEDAWEFAKQVSIMNPDDKEECWGTAKYNTINFGYSYQEAKAEYEAWKKRDEIRVGDEVEYTGCNETVRFVVTGIVGERAYGFKHTCEYDDAGEYCDIDMLRKTGRHFDEVEELLKKMKEK